MIPSSNYTEYFRFDVNDTNGSRLFTNVVGFHSTGQISSNLESLDGQIFHQEVIEKINLQRIDLSHYDLEQKVKDVALEHLKELHQTIAQLQDLNLPILNAIDLGVFSECRNSMIEEKGEKTEADSFKEFLQAVEQRSRNDYLVRLNMEPGSQEYYLKLLAAEGHEETGYYPAVTQCDGKYNIIDDEWPLEAALARLLVINPYSKIPYPTFENLLDAYHEARCHRYKCIGSDFIQDYELYSEGKIVFKRSGYDIYVYDKNLFKSLCMPPENKYPWLDCINEEFIDRVIKKGYVPESCRGKLEQYKDLPIIHVIKHETGIYGNVKNEQEIRKKEVNALENIDKFLFHYIMHLCESSDHDSFSISKTGESENLQQNEINNLKTLDETWDKLKDKYKYLRGTQSKRTEKKKGDSILKSDKPAWEKLNQIHKYLSKKSDKSDLDYKYLSKEIDESDLDLSEESLPDLLRFIKMFNLAISVINCRRKEDKITFGRGSYALRKRILEIIPNFFSFEVFSRTLFHERFKDPEYLANPKNWFDERVGDQARIYANTFILAKALSDCTLAQIILGVRGNTASGKSTLLGHKKGILNTDPIKRLLKEGTKIRNSQIHVEGAMLFDLCFDEIAHHTTLNYIVDLRLIKLKDIEDYLIIPAKKRNIHVVLSDFDVPLLTTLNRVLKRDPRGEDPVPSLKPMIEGFEGIRENRLKIINFIENDDTIQEYNLYYLNKLVAKKENGKIIPIDQTAYDECLRVPSKQEVEECLELTIDDKYLRKAVKRGDLEYHEALKIAERWKGKKVRDALEAHAKS